VSISLLFLGFLLGMRHALESDHVAAVASLASRSPSVGDSLRQGAVWGAGHTLALLLFGSLVLVLDAIIPEVLAQRLEFMVGLMLILLGIDVLRRLRGEWIPVGVRDADDSLFRYHHPTGCLYRQRDTTRGGFPLRALLVGVMHGMAGSAALILLTLQSVQSPQAGLVYILLFGVGSITGMAALSALIALPLRYSCAGSGWAYSSLQGVVGLVTLVVGTTMVYHIGFSGGFPI